MRGSIYGLLLIFMFLVDGVVGGKFWSQREIEIDEYLELHNKLAIKTVKDAGQRTWNDGPFYGAKGAINVWNVRVEPNEWSQSAIIVGNKDPSRQAFLEAGYSVTFNIALINEG
ncbi:hypothetical protein QJS10_CPA06g00944 [Acorus calamus]|uniref:Uncharacterized protein n=1 Tax=Acorus calamus TaxID=4465 RepID=A0AAV9ELJ6_ACOCL|nr:hypothetical protein QJS10_CPA06g00944 [Acorus calamus]